MKIKRCTKCGMVKFLSEFNKNKTTKDDYHGWCRECCRKYRKKHSKQSKESRKKYYQEHKEQEKDVTEDIIKNIKTN